MTNRMAGGVKYCLLIGLMLISILGMGQNSEPTPGLKPFLLLEKPGTKHRIRYYAGDQIEYKLKDKKRFQKAIIVGFTDTSFFVNDYTEVHLADVSDLADRSKVKGIHGLAFKTLMAIPVFFVLSAANNVFNTGKRPIIDEEVYYLSATFVGISGLGFLYNGKRYRLKNRWRIIIVRL